MPHFRLKELRKDDKFWRVDWIGKVAYNPNVDSEPKVHVLLSELLQGYTDPLKNASLSGERMDLWVGVGQLPLVSIGSVWHNRELYSVAGNDGSSAKLERFVIEPEDRLTTSFAGRLEANGRHVPCIPKRYYEVGVNFKHIADIPLWAYPVTGKSFSYVLISPAELLRSYYLCSNKVVPAVFTNDIGELIDLDESKRLDDGSVFLMLWKHIDDDDSWFIARWFAGAETQREIEMFNRSLMAASANAPATGRSTKHAFPIEIDFPFDDATTLSAYGKHLKIADARPGINEEEVWAFLVLGIRSCAHPLPFTNLAVERKNNAQQGANADDPGLPATAFPPSPMPPSQLLPAGGIDLGSDDEPNKDVRAILLQMFKDRFVDLLGRELIRDPKATQKYKSAKGMSKDPEKFSGHGTGQGTHVGSNLGKVDVRQATNPFKTRLPADLKTFCEVVKLIRAAKQRDGWSVETVAIGERSWVMDSEDIATCFPSSIRGCHSWHLMATTPERPRAIIAVRIDAPTGTTYLLEMERKNDAHCVLVLCSDDRKPLDDAILDRFLCETARENGWPPMSMFTRLLRTKLRHSEERTPQAFATAMLRKIAELQ